VSRINSTVAKPTIIILLSFVLSSLMLKDRYHTVRTILADRFFYMVADSFS
jgi:hypothetical protein